MKKIAALWLTLSAIYCLSVVAIEYSGFPVSGFRGAAMLLFQWSVTSVAAAGLLGLIVINRWIAAAILPLFCAASAALAYFRLTMAVSLTPAIVELWWVTGTATAMDLVSVSLVLSVTTGFAVGVIFAVWRWKKCTAERPLLWTLLFAVMAATAFVPQVKSAVMARAPYSIWSSFSGFMQNRKVAAEVRDSFEGVEAVSEADSLTVVMVIGESLRADHLGLNGYERNTTPTLSRLPNLISIKNLYSHTVFTHLSVPFMLTRATADNMEVLYEEQSFITLFKKAGFKTVWISNQEESTTYTYFMNEADTLIRNSPGINIYNFKQHLDEELLPYVDSYASDSPLRLLVIHTIGSHWWYGSHYRADMEGKFAPEARSKVLSENTREQMINSYDNTVLATDLFLSQLIRKIESRRSILFYQSDHGESLGEEGRFLHGVAAPELHYPAAMIWYSDSYAASYPQLIERLQENSADSLTTEHIFHSILDAALIDTEVKEKDKSIFK